MLKFILRLWCRCVRVNVSANDFCFLKSSSQCFLNVLRSVAPKFVFFSWWKELELVVSSVGLVGFRHEDWWLVQVYIWVSQSEAELRPQIQQAASKEIDKDLSVGAGGDYIYLWYYRGSGEFNTPIVDIYVTTVAESEVCMLRNGWERLTCDLNWIHVWVKRERQTYVCDVAATDSSSSDEQMLRAGYIRMDEDTNRGADGDYVFIWYRQTTDPQRALADLQVSTNGSERQVLAQRNYQKVNVDLNEGTDLWYKTGESDNPIKATILLLNPEAVREYENAEVNVIKRNLNTANNGWIEYLCFYQWRPEKSSLWQQSWSVNHSPTAGKSFWWRPLTFLLLLFSI